LAGSEAGTIYNIDASHSTAVYIASPTSTTAGNIFAVFYVTVESLVCLSQKQ